FRCLLSSALFSCIASPTSDVYTLSLHDALPISRVILPSCRARSTFACALRLISPTSSKNRVPPSACSNLPIRCLTAEVKEPFSRSEEHTSELQSRFDLVCRLLLEKKKYDKNDTT